MASPGFYTSSPTVILPPQHPNQHVGSHYSPFLNGSSNTFSQSMECSTSNPPVLTSSLAGRKRSRGDITAPDDDDEDASSAASAGQQFRESIGGFTHDSKMVMIDASSESTTESRVASSIDQDIDRKNFSISHFKRPSTSSRKSQRTNTGAPCEDHLAQLVLPSSMREATMEPLIDEATRVLGISWSRMDSTEALRIIQAAYQKWIQKYYPSLKNVNIWFENSAIPGYLVCAVNSYNDQQAWYIFSHDLTEARIVTTETSQLVPRLQMLPALHLAAPGGQIHAKTDSVIASRDVCGVDQALVAESLLLPDQVQKDPVGPSHEANQVQELMNSCAAHQMEVD